MYKLLNHNNKRRHPSLSYNVACTGTIYGKIAPIVSNRKHENEIPEKRTSL